MKNVKKLGIWMDHSNAFVLELANDTIIESSVVIETTLQDEEDVLNKTENNVNNKKHQFQSNFYKKLSDIIKNFHEVILFGPTDAKNTLFNLLKADHFFENIKVEIKNSDKMTTNQMHHFVKEYFK